MHSQVLMTWGATLIVFSYVAVQVASHNVECREFDDFPPASDQSPSLLEDLRVELVTVGGEAMMNISWKINIDSSIEYLTDTRIVTDDSVFHCKYNPVWAKADLNTSKEAQKSFHYLVKGTYGFNSIQAANIPVPSTHSGFLYKYTELVIPRPTQRVTPGPTTAPIDVTTEVFLGKVIVTSTVHTIFGALAGLTIVISCYIIYKCCGATSLGCGRSPTFPMAPVPVLMVYPAENSAFQQAVVALAEFLQWHGGCSVDIDMWQRRKIAELGPMRWLAEKVKTAHRVLIVHPQPSSQHCHSPPNHALPETSIPAAAHDLYPLILNMVASCTKSASDLAQFCVVQMGEQQDKKRSKLPLELRACKTFCLMKDLNKLCRSIHTQNQDDKNLSNLIFRPAMTYSEKSTLQLRAAVETLSGHQPSIFGEEGPLKSVFVIA